MSMSRKNAYDFVKVIGCGGMGSVELWRRKVLDEGLVVAKRVYLSEFGEEEETEARREAQVLRKLHHPHIVKYIGSFVNKDSCDLTILQEYCEGGDLSALIREEQKGRAAFPAADVIRWLSHTAHALLYCHVTMQVLHRDLKPSNVFLSADRSKALLGDFGVARALESTKALVNTFIGTQTYMSPEVLRMQSYGLKTDVWGLGTIFYEVCSLRKLFEATGKPLDLVKAMIAWERPPPLPAAAGYPPEFDQLCRAMLTKEVEKRPTLSELLARDGPLREAVLALEREIEWPESLLPPLACGVVAEGEEEEERGAEEAGRAGGRAPPRFLDVRSAEAPQADGSLAAQVQLHTVSARASGGNLLLPPPSDDDTLRRPTTAPSSVPSKTLSAFAAGAAERLKASSLAREPATQRDLFDDGRLQMPERPLDSDAPWVQFSAVAGGGLAAGTDGSDEAVVRKAAQIRDLVELTVRRRELEAVVSRALEEPSEPRRPATALGAQPSPAGPAGLPPCPGPALGQEPPASPPSTRWGQGEVQMNAVRVGARLRCVETLHTEEPDPVELNETLRHVKEMDLDSEDCGQAVLAHAHRLSMKAEDAVRQEDPPIPAMEQAVDLLEAVKGQVPTAQRSLDHAGKRLLNAHELRRQVGLRCICGHGARTLSVWRSEPFADVADKVARKWHRSVESLQLQWSHNGEPELLQTEEHWQQCLAANPRGPIELLLQPEPLPHSGFRQGSRRKGPSLAGLASSGAAVGRGSERLSSKGGGDPTGTLLQGSAVPAAAPVAAPKAKVQPVFAGNWRRMSS